MWAWLFITTKLTFCLCFWVWIINKRGRLVLIVCSSVQAKLKSWYWGKIKKKSSLVLVYLFNSKFYLVWNQFVECLKFLSWFLFCYSCYNDLYLATSPGQHDLTLIWLSIFPFHEGLLSVSFLQSHGILEHSFCYVLNLMSERNLDMLHA